MLVESGSDPGSKDPEFVEVGVKMPDGDPGSMKLPVLPPHKILDFLFGSCQLDIDDRLVQRFWQHMEEVQDPWALSTRQYRLAVGKPVIPVGLYGDEANIGMICNPWAKVYGFFLSVVLFRPRSTRASRFLIAAIESTKILDVESTMYPIMELITNSLNKAAEEGVQGRYFLVSELRGDQAWFRNIFKHSSWWTSRQVCCRCKATTDPTELNYTIYSSPNGWQHTLRTTEEFLMDELPDNMCALFQYRASFTTPMCSLGSQTTNQPFKLSKSLVGYMGYLINYICCIFHLCGYHYTR